MRWRESSAVVADPQNGIAPWSLDHIVVSQWAFNTPGQPSMNTVVGPGEILMPSPGIPGDLNNDGVVDAADLGLLPA